MQKDINLKASARLVQQLGEQLISNELVALMELIKNSFDADATRVKVKINTEEMTPYGKGKITIEDNGHGMIPSILENAFYTLATTHKVKNKFSLKFNRLSLGNKGLGRLSFQRLGYFIIVNTSPDIDLFKNSSLITQKDIDILSNFNNFNLRIDWSKLDSDLDLRDLVAEYSELFIENKKFGTSLEIQGLRNIEFWDKKNKYFNELVEQVYSMTNPYQEKDDKDKFNIKLYINNEIIENKDFNEEAIKEISMTKVDFNFTEKGFFNLKIDYKETFLHAQYTKTIKKLQNDGFEIINETPDYNDYLQKEFIFDLYDLKEGDKIKSSKNEVTFNKLQCYFINNKLAFPGSFHGKIYFHSRDSQFTDGYQEILTTDNRFENINTISLLRNLWDSIKGISIFRSGFRVLPYGQNDWVGFDKLNRTVKFNPFGYKNLSGYISLDGESSKNLREKTNREGFIIDDYSQNFFLITQTLLAQTLIKDYANFREGFEYKVTGVKKESEIYSTKNGLIKFKIAPSAESEINESIKEITTIRKKVKIEIENLNIDESKKKKLVNEFKKIEKTSSKVLSSHTKHTKHLEQTSNIKDRELVQVREVLPMIGQSIILEALTHELHRIKTNIESNAKESIRILDNLEYQIRKEISSKQRNILTDIQYLGEQLLHIEPTYKKKKLIFENIDLKKYLHEMYIKEGPLQRKAEKQNIRINIIGDSLVIKANKGYITTIFDNLFLNSLYWIEVANSEEKNITFELNRTGKVIVYDSGEGIAKEVEKTLFEPFTTLKADGRGLGLYIVHSLLTESKATIKLLEEERKDRKYKFEIAFTELTNGNGTLF